MLSIDNDRRLVANTVAQFLGEDDNDGQGFGTSLTSVFPEPANERSKDWLAFPWPLNRSRKAPRNTRKLLQTCALAVGLTGAAAHA
ncbi:hypothetical protein ACTMU2_31785 [Cupriavidus basilensis]